MSQEHESHQSISPPSLLLANPADPIYCGLDNVVNIAEISLSSPLMADLLSNIFSRGLVFRFRARGFSMFPFIRDGDVLTIGPFHSNGPNTGDIVAFCRPDYIGLVVHRVIFRKKEVCCLKGDNSKVGQSDGIIPSKNLLGLVTRLERGERVVHLGMGAERGFIAFLSRLNLLYFIIHLAVLLYDLAENYQLLKKISSDA